MICLQCGQEQTGEVEQCSSCRQPFAVFPPYVRCNHVAQLQQALRRSQAGQLDLEQFAEIYGRFAELGLNFQQRWRGDAQTRLVDGLPLELKGRYQTGVAELDQALDRLEEALQCLDQCLETGSDADFAQADDLLTDFFKIGCGACAILMEELDKVETNDSAGTFLDVRGL
ncbi:MAG: hypothetical protein KF760_35085 [Candidatus Eremiobacteraeota bacterium]|nr:hypothetical protein [Candidatus Eremiobacteraeota bacterium]MCW5870862.1 hypothetical protein [Candidatus Eremiobacteraeota bacterium]